MELKSVLGPRRRARVPMAGAEWSVNGYLVSHWLCATVMGLSSPASYVLIEDPRWFVRLLRAGMTYCVTPECIVLLPFYVPES